MIRVIDSRVVQYGKNERIDYQEISGLSTDTKPTEGIATGSVFLEVDTGDAYFFDESSKDWNKVGG